MTFDAKSLHIEFENDLHLDIDCKWAKARGYDIEKIWKQMQDVANKFKFAK